MFLLDKNNVDKVVDFPFSRWPSYELFNGSPGFALKVNNSHHSSVLKLEGGKMCVVRGKTECGSVGRMSDRRSEENEVEGK